MVVEVYLKSNATESAESLPDSIHELEMMKEEIQHSLLKLQESTDLLVEEFRSAEGDEAKEYYEYAQENLGIIKYKTARIDEIQKKIDSIRCVFPKNTIVETRIEGNSEAGHFI